MHWSVDLILAPKASIITDNIHRPGLVFYRDLAFLVRFASEASLSLNKLLEPIFKILAKSLSSRLSLTFKEQC